MLILDGKEVSQALRTQMKLQAQKISEKLGRKPGLAVVLIGEDPASQIYVKNKIKACEETGIHSFEHRLPVTVSALELKQLIEKLNADSQVDGILVQLPLPAQLDEDQVLTWIQPTKDPDALTAENMGLMWTGKPRTMPCTPSGVMEILKYYKIETSGRKAVVIGRSNIVGKPMAQLLLNADATVTICHSRTKNLEQHTQAADIVVVAAGRSEFLGKSAFKAGAVVIDVGIHRKEENGKVRICGDVRSNELQGYVAALTPVPGGVGPMTITMLLKNTLKLAELKI